MTAEQSKATSLITKYARNAISLLTSDALNKATTFVIYLLVARYFGARTFGQLSLGLMLFYVFQVFATAGLPIIVTRAIAQRPGRTDRYCANGLAAAGLAGIVATLALFMLTLALQYDKDTTLLICLIGLGVAPYGLALIVESVFRGRECMHYIAVANVIANTVKVLGAAALLTFGYNIYSIAILLVGVRWLILFVELAFYVRFLNQTASRIRLRFVKRLLLRSFTFLGIDAVIAGWSSVTTLLLSKLATEVEVGIFSAACQVLHPISLIYRSVVSAVFPAMCKRTIAQASDLIEMTRWLSTFLVLLGMPAVVLLIPFANSLVSFLYGAESMRQAGPLIQIIASTLVITSTTAVFGHALWAAGQERVVLRIVTFNLAATTLLGFLLIRSYGVSGAACTTLLISVFNGAQHWYACKELLRTHPLDKTVLAPLFAAAMMSLPIIWLYKSNQAAAGVSACLVYVASVGIIVLIREHRNLRNLPSRYFAPLINS